jgi:hypothetical protein
VKVPNAAAAVFPGADIETAGATRRDHRQRFGRADAQAQQALRMIIAGGGFARPLSAPPPAALAERLDHHRPIDARQARQGITAAIEGRLRRRRGQLYGEIQTPGSPGGVIPGAMQALDRAPRRRLINHWQGWKGGGVRHLSAAYGSRAEVNG